MTAYVDFLPQLLPLVPDCPQPVAIQALRNSAIEFCEQTLFYTYEHADIDVVADTSRYNLTLPAGTEVAKVIDAWVDKLVLEPVGEDFLRKRYSYDWREMEGSPQYLTHLASPAQVILCPTPTVDQDAALKMILALKPTRTSTSVDDTIYNRWVEEIVYGALTRIHYIPNQSFSDPAMGMHYRQMFNAGIARAKIERNRGLARTTARVRYPNAV